MLHRVGVVENSRKQTRIWDNRLRVAKPTKPEGDPRLAELFERFHGRLVSPGGAAALLGLSRKTIYSICRRGDMKAFRSDDLAPGGDSARAVSGSGPRTLGPRWVYIPLTEVRAYAEKTGRLTEQMERWFQEDA